MADQEQNTFIDSSGGNSKTDGDLQAEDVGGVLFKGSDESNPKETKPKASSEGGLPKKHCPYGPVQETLTRAQFEGGFPKMGNPLQDTLAFADSEGDLPLASETPNEEEAVPQQPSDPVIISDWSVLGGLKALFEESWTRVDDDEEEEEDECSFIPPHELVAKKIATSERCCYSMCEGIGRTLKGRDLFAFRDLVLTKTGYLEGYP